MVNQRRLIHLPPDDVYVPDVTNHRQFPTAAFLGCIRLVLGSVCRNNDLPNTGPFVGFISDALGECSYSITNAAISLQIRQNPFPNTSFPMRNFLRILPVDACIL